MATKKVSGTGRHGCLLFVVLLTATLFVIVTSVGTYVSGLYDHSLFLFRSTLYKVYRRNAIDVAPPTWVNLLWCVTFLYLLIWILYSITLLYRKPGDGKGYLYFRPPFVPLSVYVTFDLSLLCLVGWFFLWSYNELRWSALVMLGVVVMAALSFVFSIRGLHFYADDLRQLGSDVDVTLDRAIVQNSLGMYAAWVCMVDIVNLALAMVYEWHVDQVDASTVALSVMSVVVVVYFLLDIVVFSADTWPILTPYIVFTVTAAGILSKHFAGGNRNFLLALLLVGLAGFTTLFKVASIIHHTCRAHHEEEEKEEEEEEEKLLCNKSDQEEASCDEDEDLQKNDEKTTEYLKQAQLLLSAK